MDNSKGLFQLIRLCGKTFIPQRVLLDSSAQPLMLEVTAIRGLGLIEDA